MELERVPERFVYVPNQFWLQKNYRLILEALTKPEAHDIHIVCTGTTHDYRHPHYFQALMNEVQERKL